MKPFAIVAIWAYLGWDVGAWVEAFAGIPAVVGILGGVAIGAALAIEARRRMTTGAVSVAQAADAPSIEATPALDRAA